MLNDFLQPGLILLITGLLILVLHDVLVKAVSIAGPALTVIAVFIFETGESTDRLSMIFGIIFSLISLVAAVYNFHVKDKFELAASAIYAGSSIGVVFSSHWIGMLIFWELMAVASWLIVVSSRTEAAKKAGFRYLMVHMLGGNLLLASGDNGLFSPCLEILLEK